MDTVTVPTLHQNASVTTVRQWLATLTCRGLLFHFDDDAHDVRFPEWVTDGMRDELNRQAEKARAVCDSAGVDIFDLCMELNQ